MNIRQDMHAGATLTGDGGLYSDAIVAWVESEVCAVFERREIAR